MIRFLRRWLLGYAGHQRLRILVFRQALRHLEQGDEISPQCPGLARLADLQFLHERAVAGLRDRQSVLVEGECGGDGPGGAHGHLAGTRARAAFPTPAGEGRAGVSDRTQRDDCIGGKLFRAGRAAVDARRVAGDGAATVAGFRDRQSFTPILGDENIVDVCKLTTIKGGIKS